MPSLFAPDGATLSVAFRKACEHIATAERYKLALKAFSPLPAHALATSYQAIILTPEQVPLADAAVIQLVLRQPGWSAVLLNHNPITILHNPTHSPARQEANLMHEFAHCFLRHPLANFEADTQRSGKLALHELEAAYLGSCLQIPQRGLAWASQRRWNEEQVAIHFGASLEMVRWRSNVTKIKLVPVEYNRSKQV